MAITATSTPQQDFATLERVRSTFRGDASPEYDAALSAVTEKYGDLDSLASAMGARTQSAISTPERPSAQRPEITREQPSGPTRSSVTAKDQARPPRRSAGALESIRAADPKDLRRQPSDLTLPPPMPAPAPRRPTVPKTKPLPEQIGKEVRTKVTNLLNQGNIEAAEREIGRRSQLMNPADTAEILNQIKAARQRSTEFPEVFTGERTTRPGTFPQAPEPSPQEQRAMAAQAQMVAELQRANAPAWLGVEVPGHGVVHFPGTMTPEEIGIAIRNNFPEFQQGLTSGVLNNLAQSFINGFGLTFRGVAGLQTFLAQSEALNVDDRAKLMVAPEFLKSAADQNERERMFSELRRRARRALGRAEYGRYLANLHRIRQGLEPEPFDLSRETRFDPDVKTEQRTLYKAAESMREFSEETFPVTPENAENYLVQVTGAAGYTVPILVTGLINPAAGVATAAAMGSGEAAERAVEAGAEETQIGLAAVLGTVPGAVDYLPIANLFNIVRRVGGPMASTFWGEVVKGAVQQGLIEGTTEGVQEFLQNSITHMTYNPDHPLWEGVPEAIKVGGGAGVMFGLFGGGAAGAQGALERRRARSVEEQIAMQQKELAEIVEGEKTAAELEAERADAPSAEQVIAETDAESAQLKEETTRETVEQAGLPAAGQKVEVKFPDGSVENLEVGAYETMPSGSIRVNLVDHTGEVAFTGNPADIEMRPVAGEGTKKDPVLAETAGDVDRAAAHVSEPTPGQAESDNYRQGHMKWQGFDLAIETPAGGTRTDSKGRWQVDDFPAHYGKIKGTRGADGDHLDFYMGSSPESTQVIILDQINPETGQFDEHKIFLGFPEEGRQLSIEDPPAWLEAYNDAFSDGSALQRIGDIDAITLEQFQAWLKNGDTTKPFRYNAPQDSRGRPTAQDSEGPVTTPSLGPAPHADTETTPPVQGSVAPRVEEPGPSAAAPSVDEPVQIAPAEPETTHAIPPPVRQGRLRGARNEPKNVSTLNRDLMPFLARAGGIKDVGGELKAMDAHLWKLPFIPKLVQEGGMDPDIARERAIEEGFLPEGAEIADLYEAIRVALGGVPVRRPEDVGAELDEQDQARAAGARAHMEDTASNLEISISGLDDNAAAVRIAQELEARATPETAAQTAEVIEDEVDRLTREALEAEGIDEKAPIQEGPGQEDIPFPEPASGRGPAPAERAAQAAEPGAQPTDQGEAVGRDRHAEGGQPAAAEGGRGKELKPQEKRRNAALEYAAQQRAKAAAQMTTETLQADLRDIERLLSEGGNQQVLAMAQLRKETIEAELSKRASAQLAATREGTQQEPGVESTPQGEQTVIPGAERVSERQAAERKMKGRKKAKADQKPADEGIFDVAGRGQEEMFSVGKPPDITSEFWRKSAAIRSELAEIAKRINPEVNVRFVNELWGEGAALRAHGETGARQEIAGRYFRLKRLAEISLNTRNFEARDSVYHELFHSLEEVLTPQEQKALQQRFPGRDGVTHEERAAIAFAEWAVNKDVVPKGPARRAFQKILNFLRGVAQVLRRNGFKTYEDIFEEAYSGALGRRMKPRDQVTVQDMPEVWDQAYERLGALGWPEDEIRKLLMTDYDEVLQEREQYAIGRKNRTNKSGKKQGTQEQEAIISDLFYHDPDVPWWRQLRDAIWELAKRLDQEWRQGIFDQFDAIAQLEKQVTGKMQSAVRSAYKMALRTQNLEGVMLAVLKAGPLEYHRGEGRFRVVQGWKDGGFEDIFRPLAEAGTLRLWKAWAVAVRANRLNREGREALMAEIAKKHGYASTQEAIDKLLALGGNPMDPNYAGPVQHPEFRDAWDKWQRFNRAILNMAEEVGVITLQQRQVWEQADYIPFYRVLDEAHGPKGPQRIMGLANQRSPIRKLMGGEQQLNDPIENMVMNMARMIDTSFKTVAMQRIRDLAVQTGAMAPVGKMEVKRAIIPADAAKKALEKIGVNVDKLTPAQRQQLLATFQLTPSKDPDIISMMEDGEAIYYRVTDPLLLRSLTNLNQKQVGIILQTLGMMKRLLTHTVTADPAFMLRNVIRDTIQAKVVTGEDLRLGTATLKGFWDALSMDPDLIEILAGGAGTGGFYKTGGRDVRRHLETGLAPKDMTVRQALNLYKDVWENWQRVGYATENANRLAIYRSLRRKGVDHADAIHEAQDLLNFSMHGDWELVRILITTVPFMNARLQGLYRLGRGFLSGDPGEQLRVPVLGWNMPGSAVWRVKIPGTGRQLVINANTMVRASILMGLTMAYWIAINDDERYQNLQRWNKDMYYHWWFGEGDDAVHIRLPKPFEVGALFSTLPERLADYAFNKEDPLAAKALGQSLKHMFLDTFAFNPIPQGVKPLVEQYWNHLFFFDRQIETQSDQTVSPELRYNERTSETVRLMAEAAPDFLGEMVNSPKRLEALIRGYLGTMGSYALSAMDLVSREFIDEGEPVARRGITDRPVMRGFVPPGPEVTKWTEEFYDLREEVNRVWADIRARQLRHQIDEAQRLMDEHAPLLAHRRQLNKIAKRLSNLRRMRPSIVSNKELTGEKKRKQLSDLIKQQNELVKTTLDIHRQIRAAEKKQED